VDGVDVVMPQRRGLPRIVEIKVLHGGEYCSEGTRNPFHGRKLLVKIFMVDFCVEGFLDIHASRWIYRYESALFTEMWSGGWF
jgi:hypothetical protein